MAVDMNMPFMGTGTGAGLETGATGVGQTGGVNAPSTDTGAITNPTLAPLLPDPSVTVTTYSEMEKMVMDSHFKTSENIIKNMVDTPEERKEKALREKERQAVEDDKRHRTEDQLEQEIMENKALDEITTKREEAV